MNYPDLDNNDNLPLADRVKHLEREASFVRDHVKMMNFRTMLLAGTIAILMVVATVVCAVILTK